MELIFLGTSAGTPTRSRNVTSHALRRDDGAVWLLDCGEGTQHRLLDSSIKPSSIDRLLVTHLHGDHCYGIFGFVSSLAVHGRKDRPFTLVGPRGLKNLVEGVLSASYARMPFPLIYHEIDDDGADFCWQGWEVAARPLHHRTPCFGYAIQEPAGLARLNVAAADALGVPKGQERGALVRGNPITLADGRIIEPAQVTLGLRPGRRIVLLGDTKDSAAIHAAGAGCDVLVHEATFSETLGDKAEAWGHSTTAMAGQCATAMGAKHLILTHFSSRYPDRGEAWQATRKQLIDEAAAHCLPCHVHGAQDGWGVRISQPNVVGDIPQLQWFDDRTGAENG